MAEVIPPETAAYLVRVLRILANYGAQDQLTWRRHDDSVVFTVDCFDVFRFGLAEECVVEPDDVDELEAAFEDVSSVTGGDATAGVLLFAARKRGRRPRATYYPSDGRVWPLFDAAGPENDARVVVQEEPGRG